ncbi:dnaJ homolog subfamily B member 13-like isoform X2 [Microplitis mediator]|uniref:dnaJ homolog subfamily B member 13-like isoform X2 n=1 Tax=Microplitis mediator TaxID=375433 RepID=UPI00255333B0|nr:dnaJ homolog subfamily B member 13-like isoform X2 [Microplitis mediator]
MHRSNAANIKPTFETDYYGVLELNRDCDDLEIKKAFRRLAIRHQNPSRQRNENIKEVLALIAEAYEVLSDPLKRAIYDQYGETGLKRGISGPNGHIPPYVFHGEPQRTFRNFFGTDNPYGDLVNILSDPQTMEIICKMHTANKVKGEPIKKSLLLTLREIFFGGVKEVKIKKKVFVDSEKMNTVFKEEIISIPIKPGLPTGTEIVFREKGDESVDRLPADIIFVTEDSPHEIFRREGDNLLMTVEIFLKDALIGTVVTVNTVDDRTIRVPITSIITPDYRKCIPNEGLPLVKNIKERGDLVINFKIEFPVYLPIASKQYIEKAFEKTNQENNNSNNDNDKYSDKFFSSNRSLKSIDDNIPIRKNTS